MSEGGDECPSSSRQSESALFPPFGSTQALRDWVITTHTGEAILFLQSTDLHADLFWKVSGKELLPVTRASSLSHVGTYN